MQTNRDISIIDLSSVESLVIGCDSLGGIGKKVEDKIEVPNQIVGRFTTRVALMEVLASGADPIVVVNNLSVELVPTGKEIIMGIREELKKIGVSSLLTGSSEENIATVQTGLGVTVIGRVSSNKLRLSLSEANDLIVAIGLPKVGSEVLEQENNIADLNLVLKLLDLNYIHDIIPVGSKGILYEANILANSNKLAFDLLESGLNLDKSAGPATVVLITLNKSDLSKLKKQIFKPINVIARLKD